MGTHEDARRTVLWLLDHAQVPIIADADALTCLAGSEAWRGGPSGLVVTPHPGEMARLLGSDVATVQSDRVGVARRLAAERSCVVILKGARSVVAAPDGCVWVNPTGNPGMAVGGMGDVLSGIVGALLAQHLAPAEAAYSGAYVHGAAADAVVGARGSEIGLLASEVIEEIPRAIGRLVRAVD